MYERNTNLPISPRSPLSSFLYFQLRTEEKRNGLFPVDVVGRSAADCERAKERILGFLEERPRINPSSPRKPPSQYGSPAKHRPASVASDSGGYDTP